MFPSDLLRRAIDAFNTELNIAKAQELQFRHIALNTYDYIRLLNEIENMEELIKPQSFAELCPTLSQIIAETEKLADQEYPVRWTDFSNLDGPTDIYLIMRLLDEFFYCNNPESDKNLKLNTKELADAIRDLAVERNITLPDKYKRDACLQQTIKKCKQNLKQLVLVEFNRGTPLSYEREFFGTNKSCHYRDIDKEWRLTDKRESAFKMTMSFHELMMVSEEITNLKNAFLSKYALSFQNNFPLLAVFDKDYIKQLKVGTGRTHKVCESDLFTINYYHTCNSLNEIINVAIKESYQIKVSTKHKELNVFPIQINEKGERMSLLAYDLDSFQAILIPVENIVEINKSLENFDSNNIIWEFASITSSIVGVSELKSTTPVEFILAVDSLGYQSVFNPKSPLHVLRPEGFRFTGRYYNKKIQYGVRIKAHLNDDLFDALYQVNKSGHLYDITAEDSTKVKEAYLEFVKSKLAKEGYKFDDNVKSSTFRRGYLSFNWELGNSDTHTEETDRNHPSF